MKRNGFSLIELMIVIVILGLLASLVMPSLMGKGEQAKKDLVCVQMDGLRTPLKFFKMDNGTYPTTEEGLKALVSNPDPEKYPAYDKNGYLEKGKFPKDSWGSDFIYIYNDGDYDIISYGPDRKEGGDSDGADIKLSECKK